MRSLIVHNTHAGFGSDAIFEFERALIERGDECVVRALSDEESFVTSVADASEFDLVVPSGGDGTVTRLMYEMRDADVLVCPFPSGTANILCLNLGNATEPTALARACHQGTFARCDLADFTWTDENGSHARGSGIMAGIGYDALIMQAAAQNKQVLGEAAYFAAAIANFNPPHMHFTITADGTTYERDGIACLVADNATIQGDINIIPNCRMDDGLLDVIVLETPDAIGLLAPVITSFIDPKGTALGRPQIETFQAREITVTSSKPMPIQIDGEPFGGTTTSYTARVLAGCTRMVVDAMSPYAPKAN